MLVIELKDELACVGAKCAQIKVVDDRNGATLVSITAEVKIEAQGDGKLCPVVKLVAHGSSEVLIQHS